MNRIWTSSIVAIFLLAPSTFASSLQDKQSPFTTENNNIIIHFDEQGEGPTLEAFVKICEQNTGYNFILTDQVKDSLRKKKIQMIGRRTIEKDKFYPFFQTILKFNDFVCVQIGKGNDKLIMIADMQGGNPTARALVVNNAIFITDLKEIEQYASQPGVMITAVFTLRYQDVNRLSASLRQYLGDPNLEKLYNVGSTGLLVTSYGPNVYALKKLIDLIDVPPDRPEQAVTEYVPLEYAAAEEIHPLLTELTEKRTRTRTGGVRAVEGATASIPADDDYEIKITPDTRTNSLIVQASKNDINWVLDLIQRLDSKLESPESNFHVYIVKNVEAKTLADNLQKFLDQTQQAMTQAQGNAPRAGGGNAGNISNQQREQKPVVVADEKSNSILITASKTKWAEIKNLLERLDIRQQQVLIETAIVELSVDDNFNLGVELAKLSGTSLPESGDSGKPGFVSSFGLTNIETDPVTGFPTGRTVATNGQLIAGQGLLAGYITGNDVQLPVVISALKKRNNANVLSIPSVLVTNNTKALIKSSDSFQTTTSTQNSTGSQVGAGATVDAGITLNISPSISAANYIRLNINLEVSNFTQAFVQGAPSAPPKKVRNMTTAVFVPDGATLYIGGIVVDDTRESSSGIPVLMDIPIIGQLFRSDANQNNKTTLYFFITPRVIREDDFSDLVNISYRKKLEANNVIGKGKISQIDPNFVPLQAPGETGDIKKIESDLFDIPIYKSPTLHNKEKEKEVSEEKSPK